MTDPKTYHTEPRAAPIHLPWRRTAAAGDNGHAAPMARAPLPLLASDVAVGDLDDLLNAVKARLRQTIDEPSAGTLGRDVAGRVRASVLECAEALDQLHLTLTHELHRREQLELQVFDARTALAQARAELIGTQAGERLARHLASHDSLTLLPNRSFFRERLDQALDQAEPPHRTCAVLYLDLDGFKRVNDEHGHAAGDELLRIVAARLTRSVRAEDVVSRLGGDEFGCLLGGLPNREGLSNLARKLFLAVSAPFKVGALRLNVFPSIGIATCPEDGATADALLKNADAAMYHAKRHQSGYAFFGEGS